jgi:twitching motility protein PilT
MTIKDLLKYVVETKSSDLHLLVGAPPMVRTHGVLTPVKGGVSLTNDSLRALIFDVMSSTQKERFLKELELDFSTSIPGMARFRVNTYFQKVTVAAAFRLIPEKVPSIDELRLPPICHNFAKVRQGFILVVGPTGQGKSSTLASIIDEINKSRAEHIVTVEDPIEFVYSPVKSIVSQRELGEDTMTWEAALKSVLRQDPNVVLVGEMRDPETMKMAITIAETGHLVFATLHTNSAAQTIDRIIDSFPEGQQNQIRTQLAATLEAVFSQRLIPSVDGKQVVACEALIATPAVRNTIREGKIHQMDNIIQTSADVGMFLLESSLANLVSSGVVDGKVALDYSMRPSVLNRLLSR